MKSPLHIPVIESLRGIAALSVAVFHIMNSPVGFITDKTIRFWGTRGAYGVQMFFVISGVVITLQLLKLDFTWKKLPRFMARRWLRIEPTYLSAITLLIFALLLRQWLISDSKALPELSQVLMNVFYLVPFVEGASWLNAVYWTLGIELQYYLSIALLLPWMRRSVWNLRASFVLLLSLYFFTHDHVPKDIIISQIPYFLLGICVAFHLFGKIRWPELAIMAVPILFAIDSNSTFCFRVVLLTTAAILIIPQVNPRPLKRLGRQSYSLYLIHGTVGTSTVNLLMDHCSNATEKVILILFATAASIIAAEVLYMAVEAPSHRWSQRVKLTSIKE